MSTEENKAIVRRFLRESGRGNPAIYGELLASDYTHWVAGVPIEARGPEAYARLGRVWLACMPDLNVTIEDIVAEGDRVVTRQTWRGTHRGPWVSGALGRTIAPTGRQLTITATVITRIADGKIAEEWEDWDSVGLLKQLGALPTLVPAAVAT
jgi:predicted ester cyclase